MQIENTMKTERTETMGFEFFKQYGGSEHDEFICDARDFKTAETIREALDLKEENRQTDDED